MNDKRNKLNRKAENEMLSCFTCYFLNSEKFVVNLKESEMESEKEGENGKVRDFYFFYLLMLSLNDDSFNMNVIHNTVLLYRRKLTS